MVLIGVVSFAAEYTGCIEPPRRRWLQPVGSVKFVAQDVQLTKYA